MKLSVAFVIKNGIFLPGITFLIIWRMKTLIKCYQNTPLTGYKELDVMGDTI